MSKKKIYAFFVLLGDVALLYASLYLALLVRNFSFPGENLYGPLLAPFGALFLVWIAFLFICNFYDPLFFKNKLLYLKNIIVFLFLSILSGTAYFYLLPELDLTPRAVLIITSINAAVLLTLWRYLFSFFYGRNNFKDKVIIVGSCPEVEEVADKEMGHLGYEIIAVFTKKEVITDKVIRTFGELEEYAKRADVAVLTPEVRNDKSFIKSIFASLPLRMKYMEFSHFYEEVTRKIPLYSVDELWFLENVSRKRNKAGEILKRICDILISLVGLLVTGVLFPIIYLAIKINSKGDVIFKQERVGRGGKRFTLYKFRTMREREEGDNPWREKEENQVTAVGKVLRKLHIDEFPQFYNLLKGDITIVGPRPEWARTASMFEEEIPFYNLRHMVCPGITGWAQICYKPSTSTEEAKEKFKYDLYYIKNRTLLMDVVIFLKTVL